jgi:hypothetical protein
VLLNLEKSEAFVTQAFYTALRKKRELGSKDEKKKPRKRRLGKRYLYKSEITQ